MKVNAEMIFLGVEEGVAKNGNKYVRAGLLQGFDSETIYLNDENKRQVANIKPMTRVNCVLNIQIGGARTYVNRLDSTPADGK